MKKKSSKNISRINTLSSFVGVPFNDTLESFLDTHEIGENIECYQLLYCPYASGTSFNDLNQIEFSSRVVILNIMDSIVDEYDNLDIKQITQFCKNHSEQNFIIFNVHLDLQKQFNIPNLYFDSIIPTSFASNFTPVEKKEISNRWISLNRNTKLHKILAICYLLSKDYYRNGDISVRMDESTLSTFPQYKNISDVAILSNELKRTLTKGFTRFKEKDFNLLSIDDFAKNDDRVANNYNTNIKPAYENVGIEIIPGSIFFERSPLLSEKELQSIYGQNFPIYLNGPGMVKGIKSYLDIDTFDDIIDHSYDEIENPFERLAAAIDRNETLLNGSTNISELWHDNEKRFKDNVDRLDNFMHDKTCQRTYNHGKIKKALEHFKVSVSDKV